MLRFKANPDKVVAASYLQHLRDYYVENIESPNPDTMKLLDKKRGFLSLQEYQSVLNAMVKDLDNPSLSFDVLPTSQITTHGTLGLAVLCGLNLKQALSIVLKFYRIRGQLFTLRLQELEDDMVCLELDLQYPINQAMKTSLELSLGSIHKSKKEILNLSESADAIYVTYPEPEYGDRYREFFDCPVYFNQTSNRIVFPKSQLKQKLRFANQEARETLLAQCEQDLSKIDDEKNIIQTIMAHLQNSEEFPSLDEMSDIIHYSSRSLRRHLQQHGTSYQTIVNHERLRRAKLLLEDSDLNITEIAHRLGYTDSANFSKAFKKLTNMTPGAYRKSLGELQ